jgi:hypothetical protein
MAAAAPSVSDALMSLPSGTITLQEREDSAGFYGVLSTAGGPSADMRLPAVVLVAEAVAALALVTQRVVAGAGPPIGARPWPRCLDHALDHPLRPALVGPGALWICPGSGLQIAPIGALIDADDAHRRSQAENRVATAWFARYAGMSPQEGLRRARREGRPVRFVDPNGGRRGDLRHDRLNVRLGADGEIEGMDAG